MDDLIAIIIIIVFLMFFPVQNALDTINQHNIAEFSNIVYVATQIARTDGYFKETTIDKIKADLVSRINGLNESEIFIDVTTTPKYRLNAFDIRETIQYDIQIPIKKIIVAPALFGISAADNQYVSRRVGYVLSEVPMP